MGNDLQKPLTPVEQAELMRACQTIPGEDQDIILSQAGVILLRRALFELDVLREKVANDEWPRLSQEMRAKLLAACQRHGVSIEGKWLSEVALETIERLELVNAE